MGREGPVRAQPLQQANVGTLLQPPAPCGNYIILPTLLPRCFQRPPCMLSPPEEPAGCKMDPHPHAHKQTPTARRARQAMAAMLVWFKASAAAQRKAVLSGGERT